MKTVEFDSLLSLYERFPDEQSCREYLEIQRWNGKPICPHCEHDRVYRFKDGRLFKCASCRKQFTVRVGTIFEESPISLKKWFLAMYLITAHKKGISSLQLSRDIKVTQKTAWFMLHRIRYATTRKEFTEDLQGIVEADETYIGGKRKRGQKGRSRDKKTPVFGLVERKGQARLFPVDSVDAFTLMHFIRKNVDSRAVIMTDDFPTYRKLGREFEHLVINHSEGWYAKGVVHTQTIEGLWSLLKRGIVGIYHFVSSKHLHRYCDEFAYRYNTRDISDPERFSFTLAQCRGRLQYKQLTQ